MKAIVLCAGLGTRLRPLTDSIPKPMIEVGGEPLLFRHLRSLAAAGVTDVALNLHHLPEVITDAVGDGSAFGLRVVCTFEDELRGSAGALNGFPGFFDERFVVLYGDVYHEIDLVGLVRFHASREATFTLAATHADDPTRCGVLVANPETGRVESFVEKPRIAPPDVLVNAGVYVCEPLVAALIPPGVSDFGTDLIPLLVATGERVYSLFTSAVVQDIGTPEGLRRARDLASREKR